MEYKQNLHIHSSFCDGRDTPEDLVKPFCTHKFIISKKLFTVNKKLSVGKKISFLNKTGGYIL